MEPAVLLPLPQPTAVMAATAATAVTPARRLSLLLPASLVSERNLTLSHLRSRDDGRTSVQRVGWCGFARREGSAAGDRADLASRRSVPWHPQPCGAAQRCWQTQAIQPRSAPSA